MSRLRKLSLSNYAKPSSVSLFGKEAKTPTPPQHVEGWEFQLADMRSGTSKKEESGLGTSFVASTSPPGLGLSKSAGGVSLYWPWGTSAAVKPEDAPSSDTPSPSSPPKLTLPLPKHEYSPRRSSPLTSPRTSPPGSPPVPTTTLAPLPSPNSSAESIPNTYAAGPTPRAKARRVFPPEIDITPLAVKRPIKEQPPDPDHFSYSNSPPPSPSPVPSLSPSSSSSSLETDSGYQAFVKKWCFAGCQTTPGYDLVQGQGAGVCVGGTPRMGVSPSMTPVQGGGELDGTRRGGERIVGF
jgi:hypothetical protein